MGNKEILNQLFFEGYYDENDNYCIEIDKNNAAELIKRVTGAINVEIV